MRIFRRWGVALYVHPSRWRLMVRRNYSVGYAPTLQPDLPQEILEQCYVAGYLERPRPARPPRLLGFSIVVGPFELRVRRP